MKIALVNYIITDPEDNSAEVFVRSLEIPLGKKVSPGRFVSAYGTKAVSQVLKDARIAARESNKSMYRIDIKLDGGENKPPRIPLALLPEVTFLNLERISADLSNKIIETIAEENENIDNDTAMSLLGRYPEKFETLWEHPEFQHIAAFSWNAPMTEKGPKRFVKLAIVRNVNLFEDIKIQNYKADGEVSYKFLV